MYETIMSLPLFKGVSKELVSSFLEKTHIQFVNYTDGDIIINKGDDCRSIKFIISGDVKIISSNFAGSMIVEELRTSGSVFSPEHLFGMDTTYPYDAVAVGNVSIMQFSKEQYVNLLHSDSIYMLNFLNYLSYHSQRPIYAIKLLSDGSFESQLALWIMSITDKDSTEINLICKKEYLMTMSHITLFDLDSALNKLKSLGLIEYSESKIAIKCRRQFIDYVYDQLGLN